MARPDPTPAGTAADACARTRPSPRSRRAARHGMPCRPSRPRTTPADAPRSSLACRTARSPGARRSPRRARRRTAGLRHRACSSRCRCRAATRRAVAPATGTARRQPDRSARTSARRSECRCATDRARPDRTADAPASVRGLHQKTERDCRRKRRPSRSAGATICAAHLPHQAPHRTLRMSMNRRSRNITEGVARAPNRSMYYAMGYQADDFAKPMIGVANGHSTITPCNSGLQKLADAAVAGIEEAGGNAQIFGTPTISDGMAMGTEGMKYSLASREVIADCIETCVGGQWMDGVLVIGGCDENMPGGMMGILRANVPAIYVYGGTILPGRYQDRDLNIVSVFEAVGQFTAGTMNEKDFTEIERRAIPGSGSCGGMYTANTMSSSFEALGMALPYASTMANVEDEIVGA